MNVYNIYLVLQIGLFYSASANAQHKDCKVLQNGIDLSTKSFRIEIAPDHIFNHTPREIKNELQQQNLIQCRGQVIKIDDEVSLRLNLQVNSLLARTIFGEINPDYILRFVLLNGKNLELKCYAGSKGVLNDQQNAFIYPVAYKLSNKAVKTLNKNLIDKIGIQWSSGYEEYTIYEVDFFKNQLACLNQILQKPN